MCRWYLQPLWRSRCNPALGEQPFASVADKPQLVFFPMESGHGRHLAIVAGLITLVGYLILPFTYTLFTLFYALYGSILYVVGPFVLALIPRVDSAN